MTEPTDLDTATIDAVAGRRYDLAIVGSLGLSARQTARSMGVCASTLALVAVGVGALVGVVVGRQVWREVARSLHIADDVAVPLVILAAIASVVLVAAWLLGTVLAAGYRNRPAQVLRAE